MSVFISGANGFIAKHIIQDLLEENYKVIGTVRNQSKADALLAQFGNNPNLRLELVPDISDLNAFDAVFKKYAKEIKYVLHTSSPFRFDITDNMKDLIIPAINGTKAMLTSIKKYGSETVERVVITSSYAAIFTLDQEMDKSVTFSEDTWNSDSWEYCQRDSGAAYNGSKKFAEQAAWDFFRENKDQVKFKLSTVNPSYVFGPQTFDDDIHKKLNTSCEIINQLVHTTSDSDFDKLYVYGSFVDVRDVARAHLLAFQRKNTAGRRLFMHSSRFTTQDILDALNEDFPVLKGKILLGKPHTGIEFEDPGAKIDNIRTRDILGFKFRTIRETVDDTAAQILRVEGRI